MLEEKRNLDAIIDDEDDDLYIPYVETPVEDVDSVASPRSNAGVELGWSDLEQQMFDLLFMNRFNTTYRGTHNEQVKVIRKMAEEFDLNEIMRVCSVAVFAKQMELAEGKTFAEEYKKYEDYIESHPEDAEEATPWSE